MRRIFNLITVLSFLALIFTGLWVTVCTPVEEKSYYENRMLSTLPAYTDEGAADGSYFTGLEDYLTDHGAFRNEFLRFRTYYNEYILKRPVVNNVIVRDDILLIYLDYCFFTPKEVQEQTNTFVAQQARLQQLVEDYGGSYYYVGVPCQYAMFPDKYPSYLENREEYTEEVLGAFNKAAGDYGLNFIDAGQCTELMEARDITGSKVDNHFSLQGAYLTYKYIIDNINEREGAELTYPIGDEITFTPLKNNYLGSSARKLFGITDIREQLYRAAFSEDIHFTRWDGDVQSYEQVYYPPENEDKDVLYDLYMCGDRAETIIKTNRPELPSVLIYGDSFTNAIECLAYYSFDEMRSIDLRHYKDKTLAEYVAEYQPDYVICIRDYEALIKGEANGAPFGENK